MRERDETNILAFRFNPTKNGKRPINVPDLTPDKYVYNK